MPRVMFIMEIRSSFQILRFSAEVVPGGGQVLLMLLMQPPLMCVCTREPQRGSKIHFALRGWTALITAASLDTNKTSRERMRRLAGYSSMHRYQGLGGTVGACSVRYICTCGAVVVACIDCAYVRLLDREFSPVARPHIFEQSCLRS